MYDSLWDIATSAYTSTLGAFFYVIILSALTVAVYLKTENFVASGIFLLVMAAIFSPVLAASRLGGLLFWMTVSVATTISLYGLYIERRGI